MQEAKTFKLATSKGELLCERMIIADNPFTRVKGLMFSERLPDGADGFLIKPCNSIHTCFMRYPIDVIFLDKEMRVVKVLENLVPWRMTWLYLNATQTLEMQGGHLNRVLKNRLQPGDKLEAVCIS